MRKDDILAVQRLDRLGRKFQDLLGFVIETKVQDTLFALPTEEMETGPGTLVFQILGALARHEKGLILDRSVAVRESFRCRMSKPAKPS